MSVVLLVESSSVVASVVELLVLFLVAELLELLELFPVFFESEFDFFESEFEFLELFVVLEEF